MSYNPEIINTFWPITLTLTSDLPVRIHAKAPEMRKRPDRDVVCTGGEAGIRTLVTGFTGKTVFETAAFNRSATSPHGG